MKASLKALRVNMNLTQEEAAALIGVTTRTLSKWESNITSPKGTQLLQICEIYCVELNDIFLPDKLAKREQKELKRFKVG